MNASVILGPRPYAPRTAPGLQGRALGAALLAVTLVTGCAAHVDAIKTSPEVDFAAHVAHRGLVVDRMAGDDPAILVPHGWLFAHGPNFLLQFNDQTIAALWLENTNRILVRRSAEPDAPVIGRVEASWQQGAIRLTFQPADGPAYSTGRFRRIDEEVMADALVLGVNVSTNLDMRGVYRAEVRDARGAPIGWLRVRIDTDPAAPRVYDGVLPEQLDGPLAAAAVELVNADVDEVERRAVDVYLGN